MKELSILINTSYNSFEAKENVIWPITFILYLLNATEICTWVKWEVWALHTGFVINGN